MLEDRAQSDSDLLTVDADGQPAALRALAERRKAAIRRTFMRIDPWALGGAVGLFSGFGLFAATWILILRGGEVVGPNLALLSQYLPGYDVTAAGSFAGLLLAGLGGFVAGWLVASFRNLALRISLARALWSAQRWQRRHMLDDVG